ncbi:cobalamin biosynthesis protein CbiX [Solemya velum gill symbiont]|nr:cobalamin biosynthesis protein CbiX [Solemya velum gill symbiont]OOZ18060.1 cobalamin biosynthesis protein CbiX [Solemya velum gill symbiont]OOZ21101.1 cobalamin biosynthesis protein CbiX [Solemya velum gill symbiont]OOZ22240.1 cobalamin biosynthesis protein CbiX [Solemya velum gill symbiont]OOZ27802.1 cobalamin biosynthesis protein CbiX [Solemya velum gill symbiont]
MMKALVVVAHGSRREASNDEVRELVARLDDSAGGTFSVVCAAFLELAEPSIPDAIVNVIDRGAGHVTVLPYFLSAGRHVASDIPAEIEKARVRRPGVEIRLAEYAGSSEAMLPLLLDLAIS